MNRNVSLSPACVNKLEDIKRFILPFLIWLSIPPLYLMLQGASCCMHNGRKRNEDDTPTKLSRQQLRTILFYGGKRCNDLSHHSVQLCDAHFIYMLPICFDEHSCFKLQCGKLSKVNFKTSLQSRDLFSLFIIFSLSCVLNFKLLRQFELRQKEGKTIALKT